MMTIYGGCKRWCMIICDYTPSRQTSCGKCGVNASELRSNIIKLPHSNTGKLCCCGLSRMPSTARGTRGKAGVSGRCCQPHPAGCQCNCLCSQIQNTQITQSSQLETELFLHGFHIYYNVRVCITGNKIDPEKAPAPAMKTKQNIRVWCFTMFGHVDPTTVWHK